MGARVPAPRSLRLLAVVLIVGPVSAGTLRADGRVLPRTGIPEVAIPDQEALISWVDGVETLVIRTTFRGEGEDFAWVVPVPSLPEVEPETAGLLPTLRSIVSPRVEDGGIAVWPFAVLAFLVGVLVLFRGAREVLAGLYRSFAWIALLLVAVVSSFTASLSASRGASVGTSAVVVHERSTVGVYDVAVISSPAGDGTALRRWLSDAGFAFPASAATVIGDYARSGWHFVAARLRDEAKDEKGGEAVASRTHPLCFRFAAEAPVYPVRLTATTGAPCDVTLYVFGPGTARAAGFREVRSGPVLRGDDARQAWTVGEGGIPVVHAALVERVGAAAHATCLTASLTPSEMERDVQIGWREPSVEATGAVVYSARGALLRAADVASCVAALVLLVILVAQRLQHLPRGRVAPALAVAVAAALTTGASVWLLLPRTSGTVRRYGAVLEHHARRELHERAFLAAVEAREDGKPSTLESVAEIVDRVARDPEVPPNPFTGLPRRREDSPGNYRLEVDEEGVVGWVVFDRAGRPAHRSWPLVPVEAEAGEAAPDPAHPPLTRP